MRFLSTPYGTPARAHRVASGDPEDEGRLVELVDASAAVSCPDPAGGCTFHSLGTPHAADGSRSDRPRRACIFNVGLQAFAEASERALEATWGERALL